MKTTAPPEKPLRVFSPPVTIDTPSFDIRDAGWRSPVTKGSPIDDMLTSTARQMQDMLTYIPGWYGVRVAFSGEFDELTNPDGMTGFFRFTFFGKKSHPIYKKRRKKKEPTKRAP